MSIDKIICIGKNYLEHALELGDPVPEKPVIFLKPPSVLVQAQNWDEEIHIDFPETDPSVQPECEIVLRIAHDGYQMSFKDASNAISDITLGLDMTLRARQSNLKKQGHPWTTAKVFKNSAILGPWIPFQTFNNYLDETFQMELNGKIQQTAKGNEMMMNPIDLIIYISEFFPLKAGDIIFTGTPSGVTSISKNSIAKLRWLNHCFSVHWI